MKYKADLSPDSTSLSKASEVLEKQTKKIDQLTTKLAKTNTLKSRHKDHLFGAVVGLAVGLIRAAIGI
ncbi:hypothetical protein ACEV9L_22090 [Vibrio parahaemolyticus]